MSRTGKKDYDYFDFFCASAKNGSRAAEYLHETLTSFDHSSFRQRMDGMHVIEHEADSLKHDMMARLAKEFMTPIEREDIVALAQELDNVTDMIDSIMRRMYMFDVTELRQDALDFSALIIKACLALEAVCGELHGFKTSKNIRSLIEQVNKLESDGDDLHAESVHRLFAERADARETMIWNALYDDFELCFDACEDAADVVEEIVMKNS